MEKVDYLEDKVNLLLNEVSYLKNMLNFFQKKGEIINANYLLNADFSLNQSGKEIYTGAENTLTPTVNNWFLTSTGSFNTDKTLTLSEDTYFLQTVDSDALKNLLGKNATLTLFVQNKSSVNFYFGVNIFVGEGEDNKQSLSDVIGKEGINYFTFAVPENTTSLQCFICLKDITTQETITLNWAKLEQGENYTQFLTNYNVLETIKSNPINLEFVETIYDNTSTDSNINWGYTSGIKGNVVINNKDFSKYKMLRVYSVINWNCNMFIIDLTRLNKNYTKFYGSTGNPRVDGSVYHFISCGFVNSEKTSINFTYYRNTTIYNNDNSYFCYKIEGVY